MTDATKIMAPVTTAAPGQEAPVICLLGPTASGKTAAALALAGALPIEIISLDSALVYRDMDIGTAKPTRDELARAPHHLIDIIDPAESYSAARFAADATVLIAAIRARGRTPLIVGGTMLYYKALADGLNDLPGAAPEVRAAIDAEAAERGWPALHAELAKVDAETAARLAPNDAQRIQRALEIWRQTGRPMSDWLATERLKPKSGDGGHALLPIALEPSDRSALHARIAQRFDLMLEAGLIDEVAKLRQRGDLHLGLPSMRCVGYRQGWEFLDGLYGTGTKGTQQLRERGIAATRQLAKRQLTWLRSTPERRIIDCLSTNATQQVVEVALATLNR